MGEWSGNNCCKKGEILRVAGQMKNLKRSRQSKNIVLSLGIALTALAGCNTNGVHLYDLGLEKKLQTEWTGTPIRSFEKRFGAPSSATVNGDVTTMTWTTSKTHWIPSQLYYKPMGPTVSMRVYEPAHYGVATCTLAVSSANGTISGIKILSDGRVDNVSLCRSSFSR